MNTKLKINTYIYIVKCSHKNLSDELKVPSNNKLDNNLFYYKRRPCAKWQKHNNVECRPLFIGVPKMLTIWETNILNI